MDTKKVLRKEMIKKLESQRQSERRKKSGIIQKKIFFHAAFLKAECVMLYISKGTKEVETGRIVKKAFAMNKKVAVPVTEVRKRVITAVYLKGVKQGLTKGPIGIYEPKLSESELVKTEDIDLVLVPGLVFDTKNSRLGRGQGYYDRFLKTLPDAVPKIGLGFRFQRLDRVPTTKTDFSLTEVITD